MVFINYYQHKQVSNQLLQNSLESYADSIVNIILVFNTLHQIVLDLHLSGPYIPSGMVPAPACSVCSVNTGEGRGTYHQHVKVATSRHRTFSSMQFVFGTFYLYLTVITNIYWSVPAKSYSKTNKTKRQIMKHKTCTFEGYCNNPALCNQEHKSLARLCFLLLRIKVHKSNNKLFIRLRSS